MPPPLPGQKQPDYTVRGGTQTSSIFSGAVAPGIAACISGVTVVGSDVCLYSGAGRLNTLLIHQNMLSGNTAIFFYDSAVPVSGGPIALSGHKVVFAFPTGLTLASGNVQQQPSWPVSIDMPFQSGLCVNSRSGQPGFTAVWTPEPAGM